MEWKKAVRKADNALEIPGRWVLLHYYEAFNLLFRIENALRIFVYVVLKNEFKETWADVQVLTEDSNEGSISSIAKKRIAQSKSFGYLGQHVSCPIMQLTTGELTRLITSESQWKLFREHFSGSREIMRHKLEEMGAIRNSLAHFRPINEDDIEVLSQNSKHVLVGVEKLFSQVLGQMDIVPTNTESNWYSELRTLGTEECRVSFRQSADEKWVRILLEYACPILKLEAYHRAVEYRILCLNSSAVILLCEVLRNNMVYLSETVPYAGMPEDLRPEFKKSLAMVFGRQTIEERHQELKTELEQLLSRVSRELALIQQDNLARGKLIQSVQAWAYQEQKYWRLPSERLRTPVLESDPSEYWGALGFFAQDEFISTAMQYPWMPQQISTLDEGDTPF